MAILLLGNVEFVDGEGGDLEVKGNNGRCAIRIEKHVDSRKN